MAGKGKWREMDDVQTGGKEKSARPADLVKIAEFKDGKWTQIRLLPGVVVSAQYWVKGKKKNGEKTKFPKTVPGFDSSTGNQDSEVYDPWRSAAEQLNVYSEDRDKSEVVVQFDKKFWMNAIIRKEQDNEPSKSPKHTKAERETGVKDKDSDSWTPVQVVRMPKTLMERIQGLKSMNVKKNKKTGETNSYSMSHPKFGCDILVKYNKDASPASQWEVQKGERTALTEEEAALLVYDLDLLANPEVNEADVRADFDRWVNQNGIKLKGSKSKKSRDDEDDDEDEDPKPRKGKKSRDDEDDEDDFDAPKKGKGKKSRDDDDDDDDFDTPKKGKKSSRDDDDEDEDDEPKPKKSKKSSRDDDDEDDDEDPKPKKSKKSSRDDDDDEDDDFDEKPKKSKKSRDDDDEDEDEDDEPKPKKGKKSKKSRDDDDEDEDDDPKPRKRKALSNDDDDDEEDEPKPKKGKGKKSKSDDDDEEDGWGDDD